MLLVMLLYLMRTDARILQEKYAVETCRLLMCDEAIWKSASTKVAWAK